jgi:hypothetical protein
MHRVQIPADASPGQRLWIERDGGWIDFTVAPLAEVGVEVKEQSLSVTLTSHLAQPAVFEIQAGAARASTRLAPKQPTKVSLELPAPKCEDARVLEVKWSANGLSQKQEYGLLCQWEPKFLQTLPSPLASGIALRGKTEVEDFSGTGAVAEKRASTCGEVTRHGWFVHPPYLGGVGYAWMRLGPLLLPQRPEGVALRTWVGKANGSDLGDGLEYRVVVMESTGRRTLAARTHVTRHEWKPLEADLSPWSGQTVTLQLETDVGPQNNPTGDWGCWAELRLETMRPTWNYTLTQQVDLFRRESSPYPLAGLTPEMLRKSRRGWLHFEGRGIEGPGAYGMHGVLNGVALGELPGAHAREGKGAFAPVRMELPKAALATLSRRNRLLLHNPHRDHFAVRRFWLEVELADGRRCASDISTATFTQPPGWPTAEGILLPFEESLAVDVWFELTP